MEYSKFEFRGNGAEVISHVFQTLLVTYLVLLLLEQIYSGSVSVYFNLSYLLAIVVISGVLDVFSEHKKQDYRAPSWKDYLFVGLLGIVGFAIIKLKTVQLGWLSWAISIMAGILIILLSLLVLEENEDEK